DELGQDIGDRDAGGASPGGEEFRQEGRHGGVVAAVEHHGDHDLDGDQRAQSGAGEHPQEQRVDDAQAEHAEDAHDPQAAVDVGQMAEDRGEQGVDDAGDHGADQRGGGGEMELRHREGGHVVDGVAAGGTGGDYARA